MLWEPNLNKFRSIHVPVTSFWCSFLASDSHSKESLMFMLSMRFWSDGGDLCGKLHESAISCCLMFLTALFFQRVQMNYQSVSQHVGPWDTRVNFHCESLYLNMLVHGILFCSLNLAADITQLISYVQLPQLHIRIQHPESLSRIYSEVKEYNSSIE